MSRRPPAVVKRKAHIIAKFRGSVFQICAKVKLGYSFSAEPINKPQLVKKRMTRKMKHMDEYEVHLLRAQLGSAGQHELII